MAQGSINPDALLIVGAIFGVLAFYASERFKKRHGVTPWKMSSWLCAAIGFLSLLLCAILMAVASHQTRAKLRVPHDGLPFPTPSAAPPAWHPDPTGHHAFRYWDGYGWTEHVSDGTTNSIDQL